MPKLAFMLFKFFVLNRSGRAIARRAVNAAAKRRR